MIRQRFLLKLCVLTLMGCCIFTARAEENNTAPVMLILGDSLSAGYGLDPEQGWVSLLRQRLAERGYGLQVINASVSGETSSGGRNRLPRALEQHHPRIVVLELGANDGLRGVMCGTCWRSG